MDLLRRKSAGELAALFGKGALSVDRKTRVHRFRSRAAKVLTTLTDTEVAIADAYTAGVNAGLKALGSKPLEYYAMGVEPRAVPGPSVTERYLRRSALAMPTVR